MDGVGRTPTGRAIAAAVGSRFGVGNSTYHFGTESQVVDHLPFGAYPVVLLRAWGGWDESLVANEDYEDYELDYRLLKAGYRLLSIRRSRSCSTAGSCHRLRSASAAPGPREVLG